MDASTSPIQCLPVEVISLIFIECLPLESAPAHVDEAPILLGRVCRSWRKLANSIPQLWSNIHLLITKEQPEVNISALETWLERSSSAPLDITVVDNLTAPDAESWDGQDTLELLGIHCMRWRSLDCEMQLQHMKRVLVSPGRFGGLPMLEKLILFDPLAVRRESPSSLALSFCPKLFSVIFMYSGTFAINEDDPPYALKSVRGHYETSFADCFRLIRHCPHLRELSAYCTSISPFRSPETCVVQSALTRLDLHMASSDQCIDAFFENIDLPSLQYLGFYETPAGTPITQWTQSLPRFLRRSCPSLQALHLSRNFTTDHILQCIRLKRTLVSLYATLDATNDVLEALTCRNPPEDSRAGSDVIPLITFFGLKCTAQAQTSLSSLTKMILSRWGGPSGLFPEKGRLKTVTIFGDVFKSNDSFGPELRGCCDEGLDMVVR